jgi:Sec-independent protein translocase protein TatA
MTKPSQVTPDQPDLEQTLQDVERSLQAFKARYAQVQADQQRQQELQQRLSQVQQEPQSPQTQVEIQQIQEQLEALEVALESQLFSWGGLKEVFWQAIRFGGVGVAIGWLLAFAVLQPPKLPQPPLAPIPENPAP